MPVSSSGGSATLTRGRERTLKTSADIYDLGGTHDPLHRIEPERLSNSLLELWQRDESETQSPSLNRSI
jgi:hypothetical protein